jgi:hypothetical protein
VKTPVIVAALHPIGRARKGSLVKTRSNRPGRIGCSSARRSSREIDDPSSPRFQGGGVIARHTAVVLAQQVPGLATNDIARLVWGPLRPGPDRSRPAWIASSSRVEPRA